MIYIIMKELFKVGLTQTRITNFNIFIPNITIYFVIKICYWKTRNVLNYKFNFYYGWDEIVP